MRRIPELTLCRILMFIWSFGALLLLGAAADRAWWHQLLSKGAVSTAGVSAKTKSSSERLEHGFWSTIFVPLCGTPTESPTSLQSGPRQDRVASANKQSGFLRTHTWAPTS